MWNKIRSLLSTAFLRSAIIIGFSLAGLMIVLYSTAWGAALSDDSYYYISSARNLLAGKGFDLTSHFPPVLSIFLSGIGLFHIDPWISIRWLNAFLFAVNIYLIAQVIYILTKSSGFSLLGGFFALVSSTLIMIHSWAMSEALFTTFTLLGILVFALGFEHEGWRIPIWSGIFWGLAAATRYIGIALLIAGGIFWVVKRTKNLRHRIQYTLVFCAAGIFPLLLWLLRNEFMFGQPTSRVFSVHLIPSSMWTTLLNTAFLWFIPGRLVNGHELIWLAVIGVVGVGLLVYYSRHKLQNKLRRIADEKLQLATTLLFTSMLAYILVLVISRSFFDAAIPMDERLLSPILMISLVMIFATMAGPWKRGERLGMSLFVVISLAFLVTNITRSVQLVQSYHQEGRGYASARDHISETYAYLRNRPDIPIYSNAFAAIYFWTDRVTYPIPDSTGIAAMKADMKKTGAYLVIFDSIRVELYGTTREELTEGLVEQIRLSEATIYHSP